ncbi:MAG: hypothetical protein V4547_18095 [Bacteroidota bacterium]
MRKSAEVGKKEQADILPILDKLLEFSQRGMMYFAEINEFVTVQKYKYIREQEEIVFEFETGDEIITRYIPQWDLNNFIDTQFTKGRNPINEKQEMTLVKKEDNTPKLINHKDSDDVIVDIKAILFDTIDKVQKKQMDIKTAQGIGSLCQVVINAIKLETKK